MTGDGKTKIWVAVVGALGLIAAAIVTGVFGLLNRASPAAATVATIPSASANRPQGDANTPVDTIVPTPSDVASSPATAESAYLSATQPVESRYTAVVAGPAQINGVGFKQSIRFTCEGGQSFVVYKVAGYRFLNATVGAPDDATNASGNIAVLTFLKNGNTQLGTPITDAVGKQQPIHLDLQGAAQLEIACTATVDTPNGSYISMDVALGDAALAPS